MNKLGLNFLNGFFIGVFLTFSLLSVVMDKYFISRDALKLSEIYIDGKIYRLCRIK